MSRSQCRIGRSDRGPWYADRLGTIHEGPAPREVIASVLADPTLTLDHVCLRKLGLMAADARTEEQRVADINRDLAAPVPDPDQVVGGASLRARQIIDHVSLGLLIGLVVAAVLFG